MPSLLSSSVLTSICPRAFVLESAPLSFLSLAQLGWTVLWWKREGYLINVRVCLLPSADKNVLHPNRFHTMNVAKPDGAGDYVKLHTKLNDKMEEVAMWKSHYENVNNCCSCSNTNTTYNHDCLLIFHSEMP